MAGVITCPLDVVKTRIQTQINPPETAPESVQRPAKAVPTRASGHGSQPSHAPQPMHASQQRRLISTSSPSTSLRKPGAVMLDTSVVTGLRIIYKTEGVLGLFRGVGPRFVWTSVQSGTMLVLYQTLLRKMAVHPWLGEECRSAA